MRIISDFHDYYDALQKVAQDRSVVYLRKRREVKIEGPWPFPDFRAWHADWKFRAVEHIIGFCGTIYPALVLSAQSGPAEPGEEAICFALAQVDEFVESHLKRTQVAAYKSSKLNWGVDIPFGRSRRNFLKFFAECEERKGAYAGLFREYNCPVFVATHGQFVATEGRGERYSGDVIVYNGSLKELEFFRVMDTQTAFQEIQMFLGGLAQPPKEIPEIPDKTMAEAKGFDKWSFRKESKKGK